VNTIFFFPFLLIVVAVVAAMLLLPFWFKARLPRYLRAHDANFVYAGIVSLFGVILGLIPLLGWLVAACNLLQTTDAFDPTGNSLHGWSFSLYGYLYFFRWSTLVTTLLLLVTGGYFWREGCKKH